MSKRNTTTKARPVLVAVPPVTAAPSGPDEPLLQPFEWMNANDAPPKLPAPAVLQLLGRCLDVSNGVRTTMQVLEQIQLDALLQDDQGNPARPLMSSNDASSLMRLAMTASDLLAGEIANYHDWVLGYSEALKAGADSQIGGAA